MANFEVLVRQGDGTGIPLSVDTDAQVVDEAESQSAVDPGLGRVAEATFLSAEEKQGLDGGDGTNAPAQLIKKHAACMFAEDGAAVVVLVEQLLRGRVIFAPSDGMGDDGVEEGVRVIGSERLHVT